MFPISYLPTNGLSTHIIYQQHFDYKYLYPNSYLNWRGIYCSVKMKSGDRKRFSGFGKGNSFLSTLNYS